MEVILVALACANLVVLCVLLLRVKGIGGLSQVPGDMRQNLQEVTLGVRRTQIEESERIRADMASTQRTMREEVGQTLRESTETMSKQLFQMADQQWKQLEGMSKQWAGIHDSHDKRSRELQTAVEQRLELIQQNNNQRLEAMRATVEEKLQGTLERRLGESFKMVSDRLEQVQRGLGEMQTLAAGVGDLKRVLTNVKTRGTWGEVQLAMLLEQMLVADQYATNVKLGRKGTEMVEFAIKLPGRDEEQSTVWLPVDSKFPQEQYQRLMDAQDIGNAEAAAVARRELELAVRVAAREISEKYIVPPQTTDFAIMFLPTEGLFAEVLRIPDMCERLQREFRVTVAGPTTLAALLNSLQMGFKTLAIQKRSSEVWKVLGAVKSEFGKFGDLLDGVHKKLSEAASKIDDASRKSRTIQAKLKKVEEMPAGEASMLLGISEEASEN